MWQIGRTDGFARTVRRFLRRRPQLEGPFARTLELLEIDPFHPQLHTHALKGALQGLHGVSVTYQVRLIVQILEAERQVILIDVGHHDEVYR